MNILYQCVLGVGVCVCVCVCVCCVFYVENSDSLVEA